MFIRIRDWNNRETIFDLNKVLYVEEGVTEKGDKFFDVIFGTEKGDYLRFNREGFDRLWAVLQRLGLTPDLSTIALVNEENKQNRSDYYGSDKHEL